MKEDDLTAGEIKLIATDMNHSAQSLQSLLENLLQWSRVQRTDIMINKEMVALKPLVDKSLDLLRESIAAKQIKIGL
ncbi:MAG TPA: hypothetical protein PK939_09075, partial [Bacteroidales bacterium]|nr:hypothetical protein [Bacteroidales bacterium]